MKARAWLPHNATRDQALSLALEACATAWAGRWFAKPKSMSIKMSEVRDRATLASESVCWTDGEGGLIAALVPMAHAPIASAMLGVETGAHKVSPDDNRLFRELASLCARDLALESAKVLGLACALSVTDQRLAGAGFRYTLSMGGVTQLLELYASEACATAARALLLRPAPTPPQPLHSRAEVIRRQNIRIGAMIGRGQLGLGELKKLSAGDVIVLDRGPEDGLDIAIDGVRIGAPCSIIREGADLRMRIEDNHTGGTS